jgi:L-seryl-tRNA(Ser) seleniumtransferase
MSALPSRPVFDDLGVVPVINACGIYTDLGGSLLSPEIMAAWSELNLHWVQMTELLDRTGEGMARLLDVPAARITPGASSAIALSVGAAIAGKDSRCWAQLPDTSGLADEILFQKAQLDRYKYDVCVRLAGGRIIAADGASTLEAAISPRTAALYHVAHLDGIAGTLSLEQVGSIARRYGLPVIVDAAYMNFPLLPNPADPSLATAARDTMRSFHQRGGNLVCFSAKYFWGPNAGGFVMGDQALIDTVIGLDFTRFESGPFRIFGRAFKMGRFEIVGTFLALREWLVHDHRTRLARYRQQVEAFLAELGPIDGVEARPVYFTLDEQWVYPDEQDGAVNAVAIRFGPGCALTLDDVERALAGQEPRILPFVENGLMTVVMESLRAGDERRVARAIRHTIGGSK